jgi:16S rRNA (uracil1498-N3)-methyltransferase
MHRIYCESVLEETTLSVVGPEAHHALRVKRLEVGDRVQVFDGRGRVAEATIAGATKSRGGEWGLSLALGEARTTPKVSPRVEVFSGVPKGPRLEDMIDQLSQVGVALWRPLVCERTIVEPRGGKLDRLKRAATESAKQCGRPWFMEIGEPAGFAAAVKSGAGARVILADASAEIALETGGGEQAQVIRLLIGPEGGLTGQELAVAGAASAEIRRFGPHVMRIETAAVAGAGILLAAASG